MSWEEIDQLNWKAAANAVRRCRNVFLDVSQPKFAEKVGICDRYLQAIESGGRDPSGHLTLRVFAVLDQASREQLLRALRLPSEVRDWMEVSHEAALAKDRPRALTASAASHSSRF